MKQTNGDLQKFIPFVKVDSAKQEVWGIVTAEVADKTGETCLYEKTKPYYKTWAEEFQKATDGKSCGNLRYMHQLRVVGKGIGIEFRDADKEIWMGFKITDSDVWKDVEEGVLTGFSQGGKYVEGPNRKGEYVASPTEVSVVDNPCLGVAHFAHIKTDGSVELRKVRSTPLENNSPIDDSLVKTEPTTSGYLLPSITVEQALRAARGEDPQLTQEQMDAFATLKALVAKSESSKTEPRSSAKSVAPEAQKALSDVASALADVQKGMYSVARFAELLESLAWLQRQAAYEADVEEDESEVPAELLEKLKLLVDTFVSMAEEEALELTTGDGRSDYYYAARSDIKKFVAYAEKGLAKAQATPTAGTPAESDTKMEQSQSTDLKAQFLVLKGAVDAIVKAFEAPAPAAAPIAAPPVPTPAVVATPSPSGDVHKAAEGDLMKSVEDKVTTMLKSFMDQMSAAFLGQLEAPKAAVNGTGKTIAKTADTAGAAPGSEQEEDLGEPVFKALGAPSGVAMTPELRAAFKGLRGVPLS